MRTATAVLMLLALLLGGDLAAPTRARCLNCFPGVCYASPMCRPGCVCLKRGQDVGGYCYAAR